MIDPETNTIVDEIQVGIRPGPVAVGGGSVWVGNLDDQTLTRIDAGATVDDGTISLDDRTPTGLAFGEGAVWVAHGQLGALSRVDPQFERVSDPLDVAAPSSQARGRGRRRRLGLGGVRRLDDRAGRSAGCQRLRLRVRRRDADGGRRGRRPGLGRELAPGDRDPLQPEHVRTRPARRAISVGRTPVAIAFGEGAIWVANRDDDTVTRIDPATTGDHADPRRRRPDRDCGGSRLGLGRQHGGRNGLPHRPGRRTRSCRRSRSATPRQGSRSVPAPSG